MTKGAQKDRSLLSGLDAPQVGLEPTTLRLTAECSAIELLRNMGSGGDLLSRAVTSQVPSALKGLTSVFGMGTGGTPSSLPPEMVSIFESPFILSLRSSLPAIPRPFFGTIDPFRRPFLPLPGPSGTFSHPDNCTASRFRFLPFFQSISWISMKSSPRPISIIKLHTLPYFHR